MRAILMAISLLLLAGCAELTVAVDVLNPSYVRGETLEEGLRSTYLHVVAGKPGDERARVLQGYGPYLAAGLRLGGAYDRLAATLPPAQGSVVSDVAKGLETSLKQGTPSIRRDEAARSLEDQAEAIRSVGLSPPWYGRGPIPDALRQRLVEFDATKKRYEREIRVESGEFARSAARARGLTVAAVPTAAGAASAPAVAATTVTAATTAALEDVRKSGLAVETAGLQYLIQNSELSNTEFAYVVANAPESLWAKNFNRAFGSGTFGNVDVVIKMNTTADFSVKGMRFDATTVASVASKVTTQAVLLGAQMAGVPIPSRTGSAPSGPGAALATSSGNLNTSEQALAQRTALLDAQRAAIRATARSILGARSLLEDKTFQGKWTTDSKLVTEPIASTVDALRPLLSLQDMQ